MTRPTRFGDLSQVVATSSGTGGVVIGTGGTGGQVIVATGSNTATWQNNVQSITANGSNTLLGPYVNLASGTNITFAVASNTLTISSTAGATTGFVLTTDGGQENITAHGNTGATETFFASGEGNVHTATLNAATVTFTFAAVTSGKSCSFTMLLTQDGTGGRLVTWPGSVVWQGGTAPTLATAAAAEDVLTFFTLDGGTTWRGFHAGAGGGADFTTPSIVLGTAAALGSSSNVIRSDSTIAAFDATVPVSIGSANATGSAAFAARRDHVHAGSDGQHVHIGNVVFSGDAVSSNFELPAAPVDAYSVAAYVNGARVDMTLSGALLTTMTFGTAPGTGTDNIRVDIGAALA